jgi:hypothetical protein
MNNKNEKAVYEAAANHSGPKIGEATIKEVTGLNLGQIKDAKKWLKGHGLIQGHKGRGGYISVVEGAEWPEEAVTKLSRSEHLEAAREAKKAKSRELTEFATHRQVIRDHIRAEVSDLSEVPDKDFDFNWCGLDEYIVVVWKNGSGIRYRCYADEL